MNHENLKQTQTIVSIVAGLLTAAGVVASGIYWFVKKNPTPPVVVVRGDLPKVGVPISQVPQKEPTKSDEPAKNFTNSVGMEFVLVPKGRSWLGGGGGKPGPKEIGVAFVPDGKTLAATIKGAVVLLDVSGPEPRERAKIPVHGTAITFNGDGDLVAVLDKDGMLSRWEMAGDQVKERGKRAKIGGGYRIMLAPDGKTLAGSNHHDLVPHIWDLSRDEIKEKPELKKHERGRTESSGKSVLKRGREGPGSFLIFAPNCIAWDQFGA